MTADRRPTRRLILIAACADVKPSPNRLNLVELHRNLCQTAALGFSVGGFRSEALLFFRRPLALSSAARRSMEALNPVSVADPALNAHPRDDAGSKAARRLRRHGRVPATLYGGRKKPPQSLSVEYADILALLRAGKMTNAVLKLKIENKTVEALTREIQLDPVSDALLHCDFMRVEADSEIAVSVQVRFEDEDECPGLRRGGVLNVVRHEVELLCLPRDIPDSLHASLKGLDIGDSLHISSVALPPGVSLQIANRDFTLATIVPPLVEGQEESEDEEKESEDEQGDES